jgi:TatD DNase family protein
MRLTDSHCHVAMLEGATEALDRARERGVVGFVVPGTLLADCEASVTLASQHDDVWAAVGFHPHEAKLLGDDEFEKLRGWSRDPRVVAIGEIGLDYYYDHSPRETQRAALERQISLAREADLPVIVHNRESTSDLLAILTSEAARGTRGVLHSYTDTYETATKLLDLGYFISFSGIATFRTAEPLRDVARKLPRDRVLIETDTPYLAPVPHRGKRNEPAFVDRIAELLAELWSVPADEVAEITTSNFERLFNVRTRA